MLLNQEGVIMPSTEGMKLFSYFLHIFCLYGLQYAVEIKSQTRGGYSLLKCGAYSCKYIKQIHLKTQRLD